MTSVRGRFVAFYCDVRVMAVYYDVHVRTFRSVLP